MNQERSTEKNLPTTLHAILRSFSTLARTLNLSHTTRELGITRQSVTRHIRQLETLVGAQLFTPTIQQYGLTSAGSRLVVEVDSLLEQTNLLFSDSSTIINGLPAVSVSIENGNWFHAQQHPLHEIWAGSAPQLIQRGLEAWSSSRGHLDHRLMVEIRPYLVVYREFKSEWICIEIGEKSSYGTWLGSTWAKSAIGQTYNDDPLKSPADNYLMRAHNSVMRTGNIWYDHISTRFPRQQSGGPIPVNYQKLVFPSRLPDGSMVIAILVARTNNINIDGLAADNFPFMDEEFEMDNE